MINPGDEDTGKKVKMVFVGLRFGLVVLRRDDLNPTVAESGLEVAGVCDLDLGIAQAAGKELNLKVYASLDEVLSDPVVDAVGLFTGPNGRAGLIKKIIHAGKHVMTTKPFELDAEAALDVLKEARDLNKVIHLNSPGPFPAFETEQILQWAQEYDLGRPVSIRWETQASTYESADGTWYDDPEKCPVAPIFRLGIYGINQLIRLCGAIDEVSVVHSRIRTGRPTPDNALLSLIFRNGAVGSIHASFCVNNGMLYSSELTLHYERGTIRVTGVKANENGENTIKKIVLQAVDPDGKMFTRETQVDKAVSSGAYQWANFYKAVKSGSALNGGIMPEQIVAGVKVINAMAEAEKTGKNVKV